MTSERTGDVPSADGAASRPSNLTSNALALISRDAVKGEDYPLLELIFDRAVRGLETRMRNFFNENVVCAYESLRVMRVQEFTSAIEQPSLITVARAINWSCQCALTFGARLVYASVDKLLGGGRGTPETAIEGRSFSTLERQLISRFAAEFLSEVGHAFAIAAPTTFEVDRVETVPRFAMISGPAQSVIVVNFRLEMNDRNGAAQLAIPLNGLHPFKDKLAQSTLVEEDPDGAQQTALRAQASALPVEVVCLVDDITSDLNKIMNLKAGDIIDLDAGLQIRIDVMCRGKKLFYGTLGKRMGRLAVLIQGHHDKVPRGRRGVVAAVK